jgi:hypothetical protein
MEPLNTETSWGCYGDFMVILWEFRGDWDQWDFQCNLMGFYGDVMITGS